jgi:hypothetical protein
LSEILMAVQICNQICCSMRNQVATLDTVPAVRDIQKAFNVFKAFKVDQMLCLLIFNMVNVKMN